MNRNYYCKVDSQEELDYLEKSILNLKEPFTSEFKYSYNDEWQYFGWKSDYEEWSLAPLGHLPEDKIEVPYSEFIDWVTGKLPEGKEEEEMAEAPKVETKFEKGKWYKIHWKWNDKDYCAKFNYFESESYQWIEWFDIEDGYRQSEPSFIQHELGDYKELSLQEIQQYLPDGHPDKFSTPSAKEEFVLPEYWFLRFKTREVFDELCKKYAPDFIFFENAGICNNPTKLKLGNYYYLTKDTRYGEEITFDQFKKYVLKQEVKSMKEWSVGSYVVALDNKLSSHPIAKVTKGCIYQLIKGGKDFNDDEGNWICFAYNENKLKWFPTLQEAQKFSDELLGKSETGLRVEDLVEGEIYYHEYEGNKSIERFCYNGGESYYFDIGIRLGSIKLYKFNSNEACDSDIPNLRPATSSEKKWLNTCIKQDKFIEQSELNKYDDEGNLIEGKEYPEYVETVDWNGEYCKNGEIYKVLNGKVQTPHTILNIYYSDHKECFKPSTKSAYDVQFKKDRDEEFKVGDWIVVKDTSTILGNNNTKIYYPGLVAQISSLHFHEQRWNTNGNPYWYWLELNGFPLDKNNAVVGTNLRKALPHEIPKETLPGKSSETITLYLEEGWQVIEPRESLTLSVDSEVELPMVLPKVESKLTKFLTIEE